METNVNLSKPLAVVVFCANRTEKFTHPLGVTFKYTESGELVVLALDRLGTYLAVFARGAWEMVKYAD